MEIFHSLSDLFDESDCLELFQSALFVHVVEEGSTLHIFHDKVDVIVVRDPAIELYDVGTLAEGVQFDLLSQLGNHVCLSGSFLRDFLESTDESSSAMSKDIF